MTVAVAAHHLGVSTATVKRRIRDGTLEAEPLSRPQGIEYRVRLPRDGPAPLVEPASDVPGALRNEPPPLSERNDSDQPPLAGSTHVTTQDVSAAIGAAVAPLVDRLTVADGQIAAQAETIRVQGETIAGLREDRGRLTAELTAEREARSTLEARTAAQTARPSTFATVPWWRVWGLWLLALAALVAVAALVIQPR